MLKCMPQSDETLSHNPIIIVSAKTPINLLQATRHHGEIPKLLLAHFLLCVYVARALMHITGPHDAGLAGAEHSQ